MSEKAKDFEPINFTISGDPRTKKNSSMIIKTKTGRAFIVPSKQYKEYEVSFQKQALEQGVYDLMIDQSVNISCTYYMHTRRKVDLTNLLSATMDCMVASKIIADDNCKIAASNDGSRVKHDKENPRVEVEITPFIA